MKKDLEDYLDQFLEEEDTPGLKIPVNYSTKGKRLT
jgi:hypothetical protein